MNSRINDRLVDRRSCIAPAISPSRIAKVSATLPKDPGLDDILHAMVARIGKAYDAYADEDRDREIPSGKKGLAKAQRVAKKESAIREILADPDEKGSILAERAGVVDTTINRYRRQLREEGRIP